MVFNRAPGFNRLKFNSSEYSNVLYAVGNAISESLGQASADAIKDASASAISESLCGLVDTTIYKVLTMTFSGALAVGETVCINGTNYTVTLDGANAIDDFDGDFPEIMAGVNTVEYSDSEGARTVKIVVSRRDRHI